MLRMVFCGVFLMVSNVVVVDGDYGRSDRDVLARVKQKIFFVKRPGGEDIPWLPNRLILLCPEGEDYEDYVNHKSIWLQKNHGPTIIVSPRPLANTPSVPTVDMSNFNRLSTLLNMGVQIRAI